MLDLSFARPGLDALCRVLEAWVLHFSGAAVGIQPVPRIDDERWVWHIGLDVEASGFLNDLYQGAAIDEARHARLLALFRLEFRDPADMLERVRGRPVYLGLAMTATERLNSSRRTSSSTCRSRGRPDRMEDGRCTKTSST